MEEVKSQTMLEYLSKKTEDLYDTVKQNEYILKGQNVVTPYYNNIMGGYVQPFVQNIKVNYIVEARNKTETGGKQIALKADELARYMVSKLPTQTAMDVMAQLGSSPIVRKARDMADTTITVLAVTADSAIHNTLSSFDHQVIDRLCSRPPPEIHPKGFEYIPYMQDRLYIELSEWAQFKLDEMHGTTAYKFIDEKTHVGDKASATISFVKEGGMAQIEWPQQAKENICSVLNKFGLGEKAVTAIDSYIWVRLDNDGDGKVTIGDIWLTAKYMTFDFPKKVGSNMMKKAKAMVVS